MPKKGTLVDHQNKNGSTAFSRFYNRRRPRHRLECFGVFFFWVILYSDVVLWYFLFRGVSLRPVVIIIVILMTTVVI